MRKSIYEEWISFFNRKRRVKKLLPSLIILCAYAIAYLVMIIALANKNAVMAFMSSLVILICSILLIAKPLTTNEKMGAWGWIEAIVYFTISIILISVYIFSIVPEESKTTAITILSTFIGGLIALYGTGITIKYSRIDKREDELKRIRPNVIPISDNSWQRISSDRKFSFATDINEELSTLKKAEKKTSSIEFEPIRLANLGETIVTVYGVIVNGELIKFDYEAVLIKDSFNELLIRYCFDYSEEIDEIILIIEDVQRNSYFAKMRYTIGKRKNSLKTKIEITSILDLKMIDENIDYLK